MRSTIVVALRNGALVLAMSLGTSACDIFGPDDSPPSLIRYEIVEGAPPCADCPLSGPRVAPGDDGVLVLRLNTTYTARSYVRTAGHPDRCIYKVIGFSWWLSNHEFWCTPERKNMTINDQIDTRSFLVERTTNHRVTVWLQEYETSTRSGHWSQDPISFPVRFVP